MAFRVGTRRSPLALAQTALLVDRWRADGIPVDVVPMAARGDAAAPDAARDLEPGQFTDALEAALAAGHIDAAVHSLKDLPTRLAEGLALAAVGERADPRDCIIGPRDGDPAGWPAGATLATSSVRRQAQLAQRWPHLTVVPVRGNLNTRWRRLEEQGWDGLVLAAAGVERLGWAERIVHRFPPDALVPAPGQGALAVEVRAADADARAIAARVHHEPTARATAAERRILTALGSGCRLPLGVLAAPDGDGYTLSVWLAEPEGRPPHVLTWSGALLDDGVSWVLQELEAAGVALEGEA
jgi:hydroxymethylbilane synthase